jgi:hypothetical protein
MPRHQARCLALPPVGKARPQQISHPLAIRHLRRPTPVLLHSSLRREVSHRRTHHQAQPGIGRRANLLPSRPHRRSRQPRHLGLRLRPRLSNHLPTVTLRPLTMVNNLTERHRPTATNSHRRPSRSRGPANTSRPRSKRLHSRQPQATGGRSLTPMPSHPPGPLLRPCRGTSCRAKTPSGPFSLTAGVQCKALHALQTPASCRREQLPARKRHPGRFRLRQECNRTTKNAFQQTSPDNLSLID